MILGSTTSSTSAEGTQSAEAKAKLDDDLNKFLTLLVTQLQNQDPLDPMDANEFTSQLVQFASVEQQIFQNANLEKLLNIQETNQISSMVDFIGNQVEFVGQTLPVESGTAEFNYSMPPGAVSADINIANSSGNNVFNVGADTNSGEHSFNWNGLDKNGNQVSDGIYTLLVSAKDHAGSLLTVDHKVFGTVTGAGVEDGKVTMFIGDKLSIAQDAIIAVRKPAAAAKETVQ